MIHAVFFLLVLGLFWIGPSVLTARLAAHKGRSFGGYLIAALLLFWPIVLLVVLILPRSSRIA
jgi:hypothetical protein